MTKYRVINQFLFVFLICSIQVFAEGTREISPATNNQYKLAVRNGGDRGCFGTILCPDLSSKICFDIKTVGEKVYFGFTPDNSGAYSYQIKKIDGTIVQQGALPVATGTGYIGSYNAAVIGPSAIYTG